MGVLGYAALVVVAVLLGIRGGLLGVTSNTMLRGIVPDELLPKAMGLNSGRDAATDLAGAPIGGVLVAVGGWCALLTNSVLCLAESLASLRIHRYWRNEDRADDGKGESDGSKESDSKGGQSIDRPYGRAERLVDGVCWDNEKHDDPRVRRCTRPSGPCRVGPRREGSRRRRQYLVRPTNTTPLTPDGSLTAFALNSVVYPVPLAMVPSSPIKLEEIRNKNQFISP